MTAMPKEIDPTARLSDGFTPAAVKMSPDGSVAPMPVQKETRLATINLCQLGPCIRYHELVTKIDAGEPQDGSMPEVYVNKTRTCYPSAGIEIDITANPVRHCSLWEPNIHASMALDQIRDQYMDSAGGRDEFDAFEASWPEKTLTPTGDD